MLSGNCLGLNAELYKTFWTILLHTFSVLPIDSQVLDTFHLARHRNVIHISNQH